MRRSVGYLLPAAYDAVLHDEPVHLVAVLAARCKLLGVAELDVAKPRVVLVRELA
jgi:hypothetical protein